MVAGIGKTRFLDEIARIAEGFLLKVVTSAADTATRYTSFFAYREIILQLFNLKDKIQHFGERAAADIMKEKLIVYQSEHYVPLLNDIFPFEFPETEFTSQMNAQARVDSVCELIVKLIKFISEDHSLVILIDDIQWLDSQSWSVTLQIAQEVTNMLLVLATRPIDGTTAAPEYRSIRDMPDCQSLRLGIMSKSEIITLVREQLYVDRIPKVVEELIKDKAQGNPFYAGEICNALIDSKQIIIKSGKCTAVAEKLDFNKIPETVQGLITNRIDSLSPSSQLVLKVANWHYRH